MSDNRINMLMLDGLLIQTEAGFEGITLTTAQKAVYDAYIELVKDLRTDYYEAYNAE